MVGAAGAGAVVEVVVLATPPLPYSEANSVAYSAAYYRRGASAEDVEDGLGSEEEAAAAAVQ